MAASVDAGLDTTEQMSQVALHVRLSFAYLRWQTDRDGRDGATLAHALA